MPVKLLGTVGKVAGIGGIALGVFYLLFGDLIERFVFPDLTGAQVNLILILITIVTLAGISAWVWAAVAERQRGSAEVKTGIANTGSQTFHGDVRIGDARNSDRTRDL